MASSAPETPIVSVIVPAWNVERWLDECLESVAGQTIGPDRLQLLVVDDGSTDSTLERARTFAADKPWVQVLTQPNSGGPGGPRNAGLDAASGRYVFFLDADDYLASEALERLVAMAERCSSDIVVARIIGIEGRLKPRTRHFDRDVDRASLYEVNHSGNVLKLFRRAFVEQHHLRLMPGVPGGEDGDFMQRAYLEAGVVSILGTYDAYFARLREGSQTTRRDRTDDLGEYIERIERERILPVVERVGPGAKRDALICGHMAAITRKVAVRWLALDPADRTRIFQVSSAIVRRWSTPGVERRLPARGRLGLYCLQHGLQRELEDVAGAPARQVYEASIAEGRRIYAAFPHFRDGSGIPDRCFDITPQVQLMQAITRAAVVDGRVELAGTARLNLVGGTSEVSLRRWPSGPSIPLPTIAQPSPGIRDQVRAYPDSGFLASVDLATAAGGRPIGPGIWDVHVVTGTRAIRQRGAASLAPEAVACLRRAPVGGRVIGPHGQTRAMLVVGRDASLEVHVGHVNLVLLRVKQAESLARRTITRVRWSAQRFARRRGIR